MDPSLLSKLRAQLATTVPVTVEGRVRGLVGLSIRAVLPRARIGDLVMLQRPTERGGLLACEVIGFSGEGDQPTEVILMPLGNFAGVGPEDTLSIIEGGSDLSVGDGWLGRVIDGLGRPIDSRGPLPTGTRTPIDAKPPNPLERKPISTPMRTGVRALDGLITIAEGQRIGLFAGSGVGKSTLLGAIARGCSAEVVVVALVGERGREVAEFIEHSLGSALTKSVVVVATSDASSLERLRAGQLATAVAEHFRDEGRMVLLLLDSVTRFARAQREIGLAAGEPPTRRGYPPSVFAMLPRLLERTGQGKNGSITAIYTVLVEGGDMDEPIADEVRGILDGHVVLDRAIAQRGRYPAIDVPGSLSRVMPAIVPREHLEAATRVRSLLATYESKRDLLAIGAYQKGGDQELDRAVAAYPKINAFLQQKSDEIAPFEQTVAGLIELAKRAG